MISRATNDIERTISEYMRECMDENEAVLRQRCQDAGDRAVPMLKQESRKRSGKYAKGWQSTVETSQEGVDCTVHSKQYQLTHLLENDHVISNQTNKEYGVAHGDKVISSVADKVGQEFAEGAR